MLLDRGFRATLVEDCSVCRRPDAEQERREWGCRHDRAEPWGYVSCPACSAADDGCVVCSGERRLPLLRCPWSMIGPRERFVVECAVQLDGGLSPWPKLGWVEWPATFIDALRTVAAERAEIRARQEAR